MLQQQATVKPTLYIIEPGTKQVLHTIIVIFKLTTISVFRAKMLQNPQIQIIQSYTYLDHS